MTRQPPRRRRAGTNAPHSMETLSAPSFATRETHAGPALKKHVAEFSELLVRDYLSKRGLSRTLTEMDSEQESLGRPKPTMAGWATMAELIRLTDLLRANESAGKDSVETILEVLAKELSREASVKMRKPVTLTVLRSAPSCAERARTTQLQATLTRSGGNYGAPPPPKKKAKPKASVPPAPLLKPGELRGGPSTLARPVSKFDVKHQVGVRITPGAMRTCAAAINSLSSERWIPMDTRERMLRREFAETKISLDKLKARSDYEKADKKHHKLSELEQNGVEERYGIARKKPCGLCRMDYSRVNLICEVPSKAIDDLRNMWAEEFVPHPKHVKECAKGRFRAFTYDRVGVCGMCAQFFRIGQQEVYRPSLEAKNKEARRKASKLSDVLDKRFWDPVKQLDADRRDQLLGTAAAEIDAPGVRVPAAPLAVDMD